MDHSHRNTELSFRTQGKHLTLDERGQIQALCREGPSLCAIASRVGCAHTTVFNELKRGIPAKNSGRGRAPIYTAKRGHQAYQLHRSHCRKKFSILSPACESFIQWVVLQVRAKKWSLDACVGYAKRHRLFEREAMVCTRTLYHALESGMLPLSVFELPRVLSHKRKATKTPRSRRVLGHSIEERPKIVEELSEIGYWKTDTVISKKSKTEPVLFTLLERVTNKYITFKISRRDHTSISGALEQLREE